MIVWSGWGFVVALIAMVWVGIVAAFSGPGAAGSRTPAALAAIVVGALAAAGLNYAFARYLASKGERLLVDPATGQQVVLRRRDSLFFVPVRYWTWVFLVLGAAVFVLQAMKA